jgi:hypothetical protein
VTAQLFEDASPVASGTALHHDSHRALLNAEAVQGTARLDAIIVPTARPADQILTAARLAQRLGCTLVALCSGPARADAVKYYLRQWRGFELIAVDIPRRYQHEAFRFATSAEIEARRGRNTDTSLKRNLGLLLARLRGWERIIFLDDDIEVPNPADLGHAAAGLDQYDTVSLKIGGYPDNSVVCHAHREAGGNQDTFVGGGALAVAPLRTEAFFPDTYNEDWFFLLDKAKLRPVAVTGEVIQQEYDPFADPRRARSEEFGDVLAEGLFSLLDQGRRVKDANGAYWRQFIKQRALFIDDVTERVHARANPVQQSRMLRSLAAARDRNAELRPEMCESYLRAWSIDRTRWLKTLANLPAVTSTEAALRHFGLDGHLVVPRPSVVTVPARPARNRSRRPAVAAAV